MEQKTFPTHSSTFVNHARLHYTTIDPFSTANGSKHRTVYAHTPHILYWMLIVNPWRQIWYNTCVWCFQKQKG